MVLYGRERDAYVCVDLLKLGTFSPFQNIQRQYSMSVWILDMDLISGIQDFTLRRLQS